MTLKARLSRLEKKAPARQNGRMLWAWEFPNDAAWGTAKLQHVELYPNHKGIRFIDDTSFRSALHDN